MAFDLRNKQLLVLGKKNMGKSGFINHLMYNMSGNYAVFDPMNEHIDYKQNDFVLVPNVKRGPEAIEQLEDFIDFVIENRDIFDAVFIDEVNRYHQKGGRLTGALGELTDLSAHYNEGMSVVFVARKPTQVHVDLRDLADYLFIFRLTGVGDIRILDDIYSGLGEKVANLEDYHYYAVTSKDIQLQQPIDITPLQHNKGI